MAKPIMTREAWLTGIRAQIIEVGDCEEWQGLTAGRTPVAYTPQHYLFDGNVKGKHAVRQIVWLFSDGERAPAGVVIRMRCCNDRCVKRQHMQLLDRAEHAREQERRGEHDTPVQRRARMQFGRNSATTKLDAEKVREIRASGEANEVLAQRYGVGAKRIWAIRTGRAWLEVVPAASVFTFRG